MTDKVVACIDHSAYTASVCDHAAWAAVRLNAPLEFLHVLDRHPEVAAERDLSGSIGLGARESLLRELSELDERRSKVAQEHGRLLLEAARSRAQGTGVPAPSGRQRHGELVESLVSLEPEVGLFVLGKRGEAAGRAVHHVGGNLERVVRALHRPLLVAPQTFKSPQRLMLAFDGSATTRKGVQIIAANPLFRAMPCHVLMAGTETPTSRQQLDWARDSLATASFDVTAEHVSGEPEAVIHAAIEEKQIDLLVMGAYGHSRIRHLLVGSTTTTMLRTTEIAMLLLR